MDHRRSRAAKIEEVTRCPVGTNVILCHVEINQKLVDQNKTNYEQTKSVAPVRWQDIKIMQTGQRVTGKNFLDFFCCEQQWLTAHKFKTVKILALIIAILFS
jgi:hypothetical protein